MSPTQGQAIFLWGLFLSSHFVVPKGTVVWLATIVRCQKASSAIGILSNNIRILTPNKGHQNERKGHSVEKTAIFEVFRNVLIDKWLHE